MDNKVLKTLDKLNKYVLPKTLISDDQGRFYNIDESHIGIIRLNLYDAPAPEPYKIYDTESIINGVKKHFKPYPEDHITEEKEKEILKPLNDFMVTEKKHTHIRMDNLDIKEFYNSIRGIQLLYPTLAGIKLSIEQDPNSSIDTDKILMLRSSKTQADGESFNKILTEIYDDLKPNHSTRLSINYLYNLLRCHDCYRILEIHLSTDEPVYLRLAGYGLEIELLLAPRIESEV